MLELSTKRTGLSRQASCRWWAQGATKRRCNKNGRRRPPVFRLLQLIDNEGSLLQKQEVPADTLLTSFLQRIPLTATAKSADANLSSSLVHLISLKVGAGRALFSAFPSSMRNIFRAGKKKQQQFTLHYLMPVAGMVEFVELLRTILQCLVLLLNQLFILGQINARYNWPLRYVVQTIRRPPCFPILYNEREFF